MKKTNFTFFGTGKVYVLKALFLFFFFFTLSIGAEAQTSILEGATTLQLVDNETASQRLADHIDVLLSSNQSTPAEEALIGIKLSYADYVLNYAANPGYGYYVERSRSYLETLVTRVETQYRPNVNTLYNEMVGLLRS